MPRKPPESVQVEEGKWYAFSNPEVTECCHCSLVHITEFMLEGTRLFWRVKVDLKKTRELRRRYGIKVTRVKKNK